MSSPTNVFAEDRPNDVLDFFGADCVVTLPANASKEEVLEFMVESLAAMGRLPERLVSGVTRSLIQREKLGTTGLGHGLALPHLRVSGVAGFVGLVGVAAEGVDFGSLDGDPTRVVILVISPADQSMRHLETLGCLAKLFSDRTLQYSAQIPRSPERLLSLLGIYNQGTE